MSVTGNKNLLGARWTPEQDNWLSAQRETTDGAKPRSYAELATAFNTQFGTTRTPHGLQQRFSSLASRKETEERSNRAKKAAINRAPRSGDWSDAELRRLIEYRESGKYNSDQIAAKLTEEFGYARTGSTIRAEAYRLKNHPDLLARVKSANLSELAAEGSIARQVQDFNQGNVYSVLRARADFVYGLMTEQAENLAGFDSVSKYHKMTVAELLKLGDEERASVQSVLSNPPKTVSLNGIELLVVPDFGKAHGSVDLVLPLYAKSPEVKTPTDNLRSALHDITLASLASRSSGMELVADAPSSWKDLVAYRFNLRKDPDYASLAGSITKQLASEYKQKVSFVQDLPFFAIVGR